LWRGTNPLPKKGGWQKQENRRKPFQHGSLQKPWDKSEPTPREDNGGGGKSKHKADCG